MHTTCPNCSSMFNVTAEQLNAAHGQVRCGHCDTVFDALGNLQDDWKDHIHEFMAMPDTDAETETESFEHELVFDEALLDNDDLEYNVKPNIYDDTEELPVDDILKNHPAEISATDADDITEDEEPSALAELSKHAKPDTDLDILKLRTQSETLIRQLTREISAKSNIRDRNNPMSNLQDHARQHAGSDHSDKARDDLRENQRATDTDTPPVAIREELEQLQSESSKSHALANVLLLISVLFVTVIQGAYYFHEPLSRQPLTRPLVASLCSWSNCSLPLKNDAARGLNTMVMRNHSISPIAGQDNQLRINMLFTNTADYPQAYPVILITMINNNEVVTAMRQIKPQAYLGSHIDIDAGLAAHTSIEVIFDIIKPKTEIHSYEFNFL